MTVQSKTFTVSLDASNNPLPLTLGGTAVGYLTTRWVVVNNLTPYIMELAGVGDNTQNQGTLAPGTANKYPWSNRYGALQATFVNPITGVPPATPTVIVEYSDDETGSELQGSYPTTLQSGVTIGTLTGPVTVAGTVAVSSVSGTVNVNGNVGITGTPSVTISGTANVNISSGSVSISGNVTVGSIINAVTVVNDVVNIIPATFAAPLPVNLSSGSTPPQAVSGMRILLACTTGTVLTVTVQNNTSLDSYTFTVQTTANTFDVPVPVAANINDGIALTITKVSGAGTTCNYELLGLSQSPDIVTPPGQPISNFPVGGLQKVSATRASAGTAVLLGAPPAGMAYRLHRIVWNVGTGVFGVVIGHTSAFEYSVLNSAVPPLGADNMDGQLVIEALDFTMGGGAGTVYCTYDLVSVPTIQ